MKVIMILMTSLVLTSCGIKSIPMAKNDVANKFSKVMDQYKRRSDLISNLVSTVKGYANHEKETLEGVINARAKATQMTVDPNNLTKENLAKMQAAQGQLSQALGRLMMVSERYPDLKASVNFTALQAQLEGTENRISIARQRYIDSVTNFNNLITVLPTSLTNTYYFKFTEKPQFTATQAEQAVPKVDFN